MKYRLNLLVAGLLASIHATANATDISNLTLEELMEVEIVSSATKIALKPNESPSAIRVITAQDIRRFGWRSLDEALATLPGITLVDDRYATYLGVRGILLPGDYNNHQLLLIDGIPLNDPLNDSATVNDAFPLDIALIERIEYVPGANSATYGDNALLGVINITTKSAKGRHDNEISAGIDSVGRRSVRVTSAQQLSNGAALSLSASGQQQLGRDETYPEAVTNVVIDATGNPTLDGIAHGLDRTLNKQLYVKLEQDNLNLSLIYGDRTTHPSSALYGTSFNDAALSARDRNLKLSATYQGEISRDISLYTNLSYLTYKYNGTFPYSDGGNLVDHESFDTSRWYGEARITIANWHNHQTLFGVDVIQDTKNKLFDYYEGAINTPNYSSNNTDARVGLYVQDAWKFAQDWKLNAGLRFDHSKISGNHVSPRLGLIWQANQTLTLKALSGRAFRNAGQYELYGGTDPASATAATGESLSNPNLKAECLQSNELILEWRKNNRFELASSLYHNALSNVIGLTLDANGDFQKQNLYDVSTLGLETSVHYRFTEQWKLNTSLALLHSEKNDGSHMDNSANWVAKLIVDGPIWQDKLFAAWEILANGSTSQTWNGTNVRTGTSVISNLALTAPNVLHGLEVQLRINNLLDRDYTTQGTSDTPVSRMPAYGRNAMLRMTYEF
jgi:iron complex outermembrane receptor protein